MEFPCTMIFQLVRENKIHNELKLYMGQSPDVKYYLQAIRLLPHAHTHIHSPANRQCYQKPEFPSVHCSHTNNTYVNLNSWIFSDIVSKAPSVSPKFLEVEGVPLPPPSPHPPPPTLPSFQSVIIMSGSNFTSYKHSQVTIMNSLS